MLNFAPHSIKEKILLRLWNTDRALTWLKSKKSNNSNTIYYQHLSDFLASADTTIVVEFGAGNTINARQIKSIDDHILIYGYDYNVPPEYNEFGVEIKGDFKDFIFQISELENCKLISTGSLMYLSKVQKLKLREAIIKSNISCFFVEPETKKKFCLKINPFNNNTAFDFSLTQSNVECVRHPLAEDARTVVVMTIIKFLK